MTNAFFGQPILNSPYGYPGRHWELDENGQPTMNIIERRRQSAYVTPVPKAKGSKGQQVEQQELTLDTGDGYSSEDQQYDPTPVINGLREHVNAWRDIPSPADWQVSPETARLLQHWRHHEFSSYRPFFCQVEAVETIIWLTEAQCRQGLSRASG